MKNTKSSYIVAKCLWNSTFSHNIKIFRFAKVFAEICWTRKDMRGKVQNFSCVHYYLHKDVNFREIYRMLSTLEYSPKQKKGIFVATKLFEGFSLSPHGPKLMINDQTN